MDGQIVIKVILITVFVIFVVFLMLPDRGVRHAAVRRLMFIVAFLLAATVAIYPNLLNTVAHALGVGRGADLLLYALVIAFMGNLLIQRRHQRQMQRELTLIMRRLAIAEAQRPPRL